MQVLDSFIRLADNTTGNELLILGCCQVSCLLPNNTAIGKERRKLTLRELYSFKQPDVALETDDALDSDEMDEALANE